MPRVPDAAKEELLNSWQLAKCGCIVAVKPRGRPWTVRVKGTGFNGREYQIEGQGTCMGDALSAVLESSEFGEMTGGK